MILKKSWRTFNFFISRWWKTQTYHTKMMILSLRRSLIKKFLRTTCFWKHDRRLQLLSMTKLIFNSLQLISMREKSFGIFIMISNIHLTNFTFISYIKNLLSYFSQLPILSRISMKSRFFRNWKKFLCFVFHLKTLSFRRYWSQNSFRYDRLM